MQSYRVIGIEGTTIFTEACVHGTDLDLAYWADEAGFVIRLAVFAGGAKACAHAGKMDLGREDDILGLNPGFERHIIDARVCYIGVCG